jgi:hypothetical protein
VRDAPRLGEPAAIRARHERRYLTAHGLYAAAAQPERRADVVVDNTDATAPRLA